MEHIFVLFIDQILMMQCNITLICIDFFLFMINAAKISSFLTF